MNCAPRAVLSCMRDDLHKESAKPSTRVDVVRTDDLCAVNGSENPSTSTLLVSPQTLFDSAVNACLTPGSSRKSGPASSVGLLPPLRPLLRPLDETLSIAEECSRRATWNN